MVEAFQRGRGLEITGVVDVTTWQRLGEAAWRLGERLLFLSQPLLRGDDVAELQLRLAQLGFDPGRVDGIFGPLLRRALLEFQENSGLRATGELDRATYVQLDRVRGEGERSPVTEIREGVDVREAVSVVVRAEDRLSGLLIATVGERHRVWHCGGDENETAEYANSLDANLVISLVERDDERGVHLHYWAGYHSHSRRGERLASEIARLLSANEGAPMVAVSGMSLPILRETQMTTVHIEVGRDAHDSLHALVTAVADAIGEVFHSAGENSF